jgi:hypothetical protein
MKPNGFSACLPRTKRHFRTEDGSPEADQEDETLSPDSPLALALAGHQPGDTVSYEPPQGPQRVQLLSVKLPPQQ